MPKVKDSTSQSQELCIIRGIILFGSVEPATVIPHRMAISAVIDLWSTALMVRMLNCAHSLVRLHSRIRDPSTNSCTAPGQPLLPSPRSCFSHHACARIRWLGTLELPCPIQFRPVFAARICPDTTALPLLAAPNSLPSTGFSFLHLSLLPIPPSTRHAR